MIEKSRELNTQNDAKDALQFLTHRHKDVFYMSGGHQDGNI